MTLTATLAQLPDELLLTIINYVFATQDGLAATPSYIPRYRQYQMSLAGASPTHASILQTCKILNRIGTECLYSHCTFDFGKTIELIVPWLTQIGQHNLGFVRSIAFSIVFHSNPTSSENQKYLKQFDNVFSHLSAKSALELGKIHITISFDEPQAPLRASASPKLNPDVFFTRIVTAKALVALSNTCTLTLQNTCLPDILLWYLGAKTGMHVTQRSCELHTSRLLLGSMLKNLSANVLAIETLARKRQGKKLRGQEEMRGSTVQLGLGFQSDDDGADMDEVWAWNVHNTCSPMLQPRQAKMSSYAQRNERFISEPQTLIQEARRCFRHHQAIFELEKVREKSHWMSHLEWYMCTLKVEKEKFAFLFEFWSELECLLWIS